MKWLIDLKNNFKKIKNDDLLIGSYKTIRSEIKKRNSFLEENEQGVLLEIHKNFNNEKKDEILYLEEKNENKVITTKTKRKIIIQDPRFGLFNIYKYHYNNRNNDVIDNKYLSNIFNLIFGLPIVLFFSQWIIYITLISYQVYSYNNELCANNATIYHKVIMFAIGLIYFIRSFNIWDQVCNNIYFNKTHKMNSICSIIDTYHEIVFLILPYITNIWIIFVEDKITDIILNCLAMEFLMNIDNVFKNDYCNKITDKGIDLIFNENYVSPEENIKLVHDKNNNKCFKTIKKISYIPYKILIHSILIFPLFCFISIFIGAICK